MKNINRFVFAGAVFVSSWALALDFNKPSDSAVAEAAGEQFLKSVNKEKFMDMMCEKVDQVQKKLGREKANNILFNMANFTMSSGGMCLMRTDPDNSCKGGYLPERELAPFSWTEN